MSFSHSNLSTLLDSIKSKIQHKLASYQGPDKNFKTEFKDDNSPVTEFDLWISELFKGELLQSYPELNFFSEEDQGKFSYPVCILDPLDGTKEFVAGRDEFVVSFGVYFSSNLMDERNFSWIFNPSTGFELNSNDKIHVSAKARDKILTYVSRTEYQSGLHEELPGQKIEAVGSIAYKLALLAIGECDLVISKKPKNIWDICAGTHICLKNNIQIFQDLKTINPLEYKLIKNDIIWCHKETLEKYLHIQN